MENNFLDYYNRELTFIREMAREFAQKHPGIAARLGMQGIEVADPYVERLIEAFCFLSARTRIKLDAEFPRFTQRLLDTLSPNYNAPTPAMGVVRLYPDPDTGDLTRGYTLERESTFISQRLPESQTRCEFRNSQPVTLWPLEIADARLTSVPPDLPAMTGEEYDISQCKGALRLRLRLTGETTFSALKGLDRLPVYISGDETIVSHLFELLHCHHQWVIMPSPHAGTPATIITEQPLVPEGLEPQQGLLPASWNMFHGHTLLQEYVCCRQRFYFFTLTRLAAGLKNNHTREAEIIVLLDRLPQDLIAHVSAARFLLFCTPVINLFPKRLDRIPLNRSLTQFHAVADRSHPLDYEIFSVSRVTGLQAENSDEVVFTPLYHTRHADHGNYGRYFSLQREVRQGQDDSRYLTRHAYPGTETYISLVDQHEAPYGDTLRYLWVDALVTNRDLPCTLAEHARFRLTLPEDVPVSQAEFVSTPSDPRGSFAVGEAAWRLISQLSLNYLPVGEMSGSSGAGVLRDILRLFTTRSDPETARQIESLVSCTTEPVIRRLGGEGLLIYGRGIRCRLTVDETGFSGLSPYLFGLIMENYLSRHVAINIFTETELYSVQRGRVADWPARPGRRGIL
ncbi:type VI secretion system baseplate subunit TssF [Tatumella terrea]|uniref:type VI secretion system baseplate subunit TssF n=1 Tax=Tatumella terrea TaxID=419007 RepID=UPI0031E33F92